MRALRLAVLSLAASLVGCASPGYPPGGPEDRVAPQLAAISPDSNATGVSPKEVRFEFDEVISERPGAVASLERIVLVSPSDGTPRVRWRRDAITVRPRRGFRPNTAYTITILPGIADLRGNTSKTGYTTTFSTGPTIPGTRLAGILFDWPAGRVAAKGFVQAFRRGDTTLAWIAATDSAGRFELRNFPPGSYLVRAIVDANDNRALDPRESFDTVGVAVADSARIEVLAFVHDTIGPRIDALTVEDSVTLTVAFDQPVDPRAGLRPDQLVVLAADSSTIAVSALLSDSALAAEREARARATADSAARADSVRRAAAGADSLPPPRAEQAVSRIPLPTGGRRPVADTTRVVRPSRPVPPTRFNLRLAAPLAAGGSYRLRARDVRGLLGVTRTSDRVFQTPRAAADSARRGTERRP